jgi:hypothetical protein
MNKMSMNFSFEEKKSKSNFFKQIFKRVRQHSKIKKGFVFWDYSALLNLKKKRHEFHKLAQTK